MSHGECSAPHSGLHAETRGPTLAPKILGSQQTRVSGLAVLHQHTPTSGGDALGVPPRSWGPAADMTSFDRALAHADWQIQGHETLRGTTGPDGRFTIDRLAPGSHTLQVTKTLNGNLVSLSLPLTVGDRGCQGADRTLLGRDPYGLHLYAAG